MARAQVEVRQIVEIQHDAAKFTPAFMEEFARSFYAFTTIEEHLDHLAQLWARGLIAEFGDPFIEGYGKASEFGLKFDTKLVEMPYLTIWA